VLTVREGFYDEMLEADGSPRQYAQTLVEALSALGPDALAQAGRRRDAIFMQQGITFDAAAPPACEDAARAFYGELLGMEEVEKPEALRGRGGVWFQQLHVGVEEDFRPARKAHPALRVQDIDAIAARLTAAGERVEWDAALPDIRRFYTSDPWGNRVELLE